MENHHNAVPNTVISLASAAIGIIMADVQAFISIAAGVVAILSGFMAIRHYYYSTKDIKKRLKQ